MKYVNPIIPGYNPDPSICRVGEDFYLVTSTFEFFPGIPIYHSRDLVNWTQIGNCIDRPGMLPFAEAPVGRGIWAPTIRYHEGRFYVTAKMMEHGNFIVSAENPAGPWSHPVLVPMEGIDPSILFDAGKAYYCTNQRDPEGNASISLAEVDVDTGALLSPIRQVWHGNSRWQPQYLEAPHIYRIGEWYHIWAAEGGTGYEHTITAGRSRNIWGPYEDCPRYLLNNVPVGDTGVACAGHGDLVEDGRGNWWCVHLGTRPDDEWYSHLGRETFLLPVTWEDGWPVIADGKSRIHMDGPLWNHQRLVQTWSADLSRVQPQWLFVRQPVMEHYAFSADGLTLTPSTVKISDESGTPTLLAVRPLDIDCTVEADMTFRPACEGDEAGMTIFISCYGYYTISRRMIDGRDVLLVRRSGREEPFACVPARGEKLTFRIAAAKTHYDLSVGMEGGEVALGRIPVLGRKDAGKCFTGTLFGVFAQCERETDARAKVTRFVMTRA